MSDTNKGILIASLIKEVYLKLNNNIAKEFRDTGLTAPQLMLIRIMAKNGKLKVTDIGTMMNLTKGTVSGIIDRLESQDILLRERSSEDKRIVYVELSEKGKNLTKTMKGTMNDYFSSLFADCSEEQMDTVIEGLKILKSIVDNLDSEDI